MGREGGGVTITTTVKLEESSCSRSRRASATLSERVTRRTALNNILSVCPL